MCVAIYNYGDMVKGTDKYLGFYGLQLVQYIHASQTFEMTTQIYFFNGK